MEDPSEDVKDGDEGEKSGDANELTAKLGGSTKDEEEASEPVQKADYSLLDSITQFLYEEEDPLPILCGYFLKVMEQLLDKQKQLTLEYLLIHQEGRIFNGLLRHLDHHSLATLLIKLIEQQIQPEKKDKWDASDNSDLDMEQETAEPELTPDQIFMQQVLKEKSTMVVTTLIERLSYRNKDDLHLTLNASTVLCEFCENEAFFKIFTSAEVMGKIVNVVTCTDENLLNQPYALNFLTQIVNQFSEQESSFFKDRREEALDTVMSHFSDLVYNSMLILRAGGATNMYVNQTGRSIPKAGMLRIRAMEQLRSLFQVLAKRGAIRESNVLSAVLRKKVIETMLYMMRTFQFCSISHQQGILVLNLLREAFDEEDLETMKNFVRTELESDTDFHFPSGKTTSRLNLGQIIKIAFELRNITQKALDDEESSGGEEDENPVNLEKRSQLQAWFHFCSDKVDKIEKVWNRKLESPDVESDKPNSEKNDDFDFEQNDHESTINEMFKNFNSNRLSRSA